MDAATLFLRDLAVIMVSAAVGGWLAQKLKLSPIVGYLCAGIVVGTPEIAFPYVMDAERIAVLSQLGIVFLMFSIGLGLRLRRMRELGIALLLSVLLSALLVLNLVRGVGALAGLSEAEGLFLAAMLMVSSSAIIGKVLQDGALSHQRHGQLAMGLTLLEDVVAVVMLTFLSSYIASGNFAENPMVLLQTSALLGGFALLSIVVGLVVMPRLLHRINIDGSTELETVLLSGLLFTMALAAVSAGYSIALGAFLTGVVVAETSRLASVQRAFSGLRDVFAAVFFVAIGMALNIRLLPEAMPLVIGGTLLCVAVRVLANWLSLIAICEDARTALRTALSVTPIGEFSFIIAGIGVASGLLPETYAVAAVGISLATSLLAPLLIARSAAISEQLLPPRPGACANALAAYRRLWSSVAAQGQRSKLWSLSKKRLFQIATEVLVVTTLLVLARPLSTLLPEFLPASVGGIPIEAIYWLAVVMLVAGPLIAIWRNAAVLAMLTAEVIAQAQPALSTLTRPFIIALQAMAAIVMALWLGSFIPAAAFRGWVLALMLAVLALLFWLSWRRINRWHSHFEAGLQSAIGYTAAAAPELQQVTAWGLQIDELTLPDYFAMAGRAIGDLQLRNVTGCTIVTIERQGFRLDTPSPQTHLFPGDTLLLLGEPAQLPAARALLLQPPASPHYEDPVSLTNTVIEVARVPAQCAFCDRSLAQLNLTRLYGVQIVGVGRGTERILSPGADFRLQADDELLLLASPSALQSVKRALAEPAAYSG